MADLPLSSLTALGGAPATNDLLVLVDVSDTSQAPTGTTKKMTTANLFTSPHMTGPVVDSGGLTVSAGGLTTTGANFFNNGLTIAAGGIAVTVGGIAVSAGGISVAAGTTAVQALTATTAAFSAAATTVGAAGQAAVTAFGPAGTGYSRIWIRNGGGAVSAKNWEIAKDLTVANALQFTPSTAADGVTFSTPVATLTDAGNLTLAGAAIVTGDFIVNTNKFTVTASTGNTTIAGSLTVTGLVTANAGVSTTSVTLSAGNDLVLPGGGFGLTNGTTRFLAVASGANPAVTLGSSGGITVTGAITATGGVVGAVTGNASTATALQNARTIGGVSFDGTAAITVATATGGFTVSGGTLTAAATAFSGNLAIGTTKFTVAAASGDTTIAGTLIVQGGIQSVTGGLNVAGASDFGGLVETTASFNAIGSVYKVNGTQVVGARSTGWTAQTVTTGAKTDIGASGTWTTTTVGNLLMAHHAALLAHGLIGP